MAEDRVRQRGVDVVVVVRRLVVRVRILRGDAKLDPVHRDELDQIAKQEKQHKGKVVDEKIEEIKKDLEKKQRSKKPRKNKTSKVV